MLLINTEIETDTSNDKENIRKIFPVSSFAPIPFRPALSDSILLKMLVYRGHKAHTINQCTDDNFSSEGKVVILLSKCKQSKNRKEQKLT